MQEGGSPVDSYLLPVPPFSLFRRPVQSEYLDAPVSASCFGIRFGCPQTRFAHSDRGENRRIHPQSLDEMIPDCLGSVKRESLIVIIRTGAVRMSFHQVVSVFQGRGFERLGQFRKLCPGLRGQAG